MRHILPLKQEKSFPLQYRVIQRNPEHLNIEGIARPFVSIWRGYKIIEFRREITIRLSDQLLIHDNFYANVRNKDGEGGYARTWLELIH